VTARWKPSLEDYVDLAAYLLGIDPTAVAALPRLGLAESALQAPFPSFGGVDTYPTLIEQAAVLLQRLAKNHPLPRREQACGVPAHRGSRRQRARMGTA
jgi:death-on-curing protein